MLYFILVHIFRYACLIELDPGGVVYTKMLGCAKRSLAKRHFFSSKRSCISQLPEEDDLHVDG